MGLIGTPSKDNFQNVTVTQMAAREEGLLVTTNENAGNENNAVFLRGDHPNYASVMTLLMASGSNQKPITIQLSVEDKAGNERHGGIVYVIYNF